MFEITDSHNLDERDLYREPLPDISSLVARKITKRCSVNGLKRKLPITKWLPAYQLSFVFHDIIAGISVGLTAIPQGIAYAIVAGLSPEYGLYSALIGKLLQKVLFHS